jgi:hypothetical protein
MSRPREYGKVYPWGCERPSVAMKNALQSKERLLKEHDAIDERKRQEAEREKSAIREKIKELDTVMSMVTQYRASPPPKRSKRRACDNSKAEILDPEPLHSSTSKARARRNHDSPKGSDRSVGPTYKTEPVFETTLPSTGTSIVSAGQATCMPNRGLSGHKDVEAMTVSQPDASNWITEPTSELSSHEKSGLFMSQTSRIEQPSAEHRTAKIDREARVEVDDCSLAREELHDLNRDCSEAKQANKNRKADSNTPAEIQRLKKRKRELEQAQEQLHVSNVGGSLHWSAEKEAESERLDQELNAIYMMLDEYGLRAACSGNPSSYSN